MKREEVEKILGKPVNVILDQASGSFGLEYSDVVVQFMDNQVYDIGPANR